MLDFWRSVDSIWCPSLHRWSECIPSRCRKLSCEPEVHLSFVWWDFFGMELLKMWSVNSILWVSSVTLLTSGAEFVAQWIFNCIILRSTVICGSVHLRKPIFFFFGIIVVLSGIWFQWLLRSAIRWVHSLYYGGVLKTHWWQVTRELICACCSARNWESSCKCCRAWCPMVLLSCTLK